MSTSAPAGIAELLVSALRQEEFVLYAQEILPAEPEPSGRSFQEVLIRFQQEEEKLIPPGSFLPILEDQRLMPVLDRWVVGKLIKWMHSIRVVKPDWQPPCSTVNLSADTLIDPSFAAYVRKHLELSGVPGDALAFEVPWTTVEQHAEAATELMASLKPLGCRFIVAGFEGSHAFDLLHALKPHFVKLSTRLVRSLARGSASAHALDLLNSTCQSLGIATIAEQLESSDAVAQVKKIGVDYLQGFALAMPKPVY